MARIIPQHELDAVRKAVGSFSDGASLDQIGAALTVDLPRRTLQRRLALLVEQKQLEHEGRGAGSKYRMPMVTAKARLEPPAITAKTTADTYIPISPEAEAVKQAIRRPIHERTPVSYNRDFLDAYRPNETFYLTEDIRRMLAEKGRSPDSTRPAGTYARQIFDRLLIDLSWNSSRLEGNTYSLLETQRLLELGESAEGKDALETQTILNHKAAIELLVSESEDVGPNRYTILNLHALLADNLLANPQACGRLRTIAVGIDGTVYHPLSVPQVIDECFGLVLEKASAIADPFEHAFFVLVHLPYLQPFEDVNKRVSRLAANIPLIRGNLCPLSFVDLPQRAYVDGIVGVYELGRVELLRDVFAWAYQRSCARHAAVRQSLGEPDPFRLQYRELLARTVAEVVAGLRNKKEAVSLVKQRAEQNVKEGDRQRFVEVAETELMSLHEGNIARYRLHLGAFRQWHERWRA